MKIGNSTDGVNKPDAIGPSTRRSGTASPAPQQQATDL